MKKNTKKEQIKYEYNKDNYYIFISSMLLINEMYNHKKKVIDDSIINVNNRMNDFFTNKKFTNEQLNVINDYSKFCIDESYKMSIILLFYSEFEKYIKELFNIENTGKLSLEDVVYEKTKYDYKENSYYEEVEKYRMLNNCIKHGTPTQTFRKKYSEMVIENNSANTTYKYSFNITDDNINECFNCLVHFVNELNTFVQDCLQ